MQHDLTNDEQRPLELLEQHSPRLDLWGHLSQIAKGTALVATSIAGYMTFRRWFSREQQSTTADSVTLSEPNTSPVLSLRTAEIQKASEINVGASALRYRKRSVAAPQDQQNLSLNDSSPLSKSTEYNYRTAGEAFRVDGGITGSNPVVAESDNNAFIIGWMKGLYSGIYVQRFDSQGIAIGEPHLAASEPLLGQNLAFSMIGLNANRAFIAYMQQGYEKNGVPFKVLWANIIADGQIAESIQISDHLSAGTETSDIKIIPMDNDEFILAWPNTTTTVSTADVILGQRYSRNGSAIGSRFNLDANSRGIVRLGNNNLIQIQFNEFKLYAQLYTDKGAKTSQVFQLSDPLAYVANLNYPIPLVVVNPDEFVVYVAQTFNSQPIKAYFKHYSNNGTLLSQTLLEGSSISNVFGLKNYDYFGQGTEINIYKPNGEKLKKLLNFSEGIYKLDRLAGLNNKGFVATWANNFQFIYAQRYQLNHVPVLWRNQLNLHPGEKRRLTAQDLNATDAEDDALIYRFSEIQHGRFEVLDAPGIAITSFNQTQLGAGQVQFVHDNSIYAPSYTVRVADNQLETENITAAITFNLQMNLVNNTLVIRQGKTVTLTLAQLQAQVNAGHYLDLQYIAANVQHGYFQLKMQPEQPILQFIHQQLHDGEIQFVHDGGNESPSYEISLSDGQTITSPSRATVNFSLDKSPVIQHNILKLGPGEQIILGTQHLKAIDPEGDPLTCCLSGIQHGQFELINAPGEAISAFNQTQLESGQVQFIHDNSIHAPAYKVKVDDGFLATEAIPVITDFKLDLALVNNRITVMQGGTVTLSMEQIQARVNAAVNEDLLFIISNVAHGRFKIINFPNRDVTQFTQQQLSDGQVQFEHDGSNKAPAFSISLSNGVVTTTSSKVKVSFSLKPESSAEQQKGNNQKLKLGLGVGIPIATVGLFGAAVGTAAAIAACKRHQKKAKQYTMMQEEDITTHYYELDEASSHSVSFFQPAPVLLTSLEDRLSQ